MGRGSGGLPPWLRLWYGDCVMAEVIVAPQDGKGGPTEETDRGSRRASGQEEDGEQAGGWANRRVQEMSGRQGRVTGLTEKLGGCGSLGDSDGLRCRVAPSWNVRVDPSRRQG